MERRPEPELMDLKKQAEAYAAADFEEPHARLIELFEHEFPGLNLTGNILDIGCGPGDVTFRFAARFPQARITAIDGSRAMIHLAEERNRTENKTDSINFICGYIPQVTIPRIDYDFILSTSFLHHLHKPSVLWQTVSRHAKANTIIFIADLFRPPTVSEAERIVENYAAAEPQILKNDFYNSLLAAFTPDEIRNQLDDADLSYLHIKTVSDRHVIIYGRKTGGACSED